MCGLFLGAHKSLAPRARTLLCGLGQATLSLFATLLFVFFGECPKFCDLAKQRRKIVGGVSEVGKDDFSLYFCWWCVIFLVFFFPLLRSRDAESRWSPGSRPTTQGQLQEELERQAAALEEDIRQLRALLAADRKRAIKDFWRRHAPDIAQRWKAVRGAIEVEAPGPSGLWNVRVPNTQTLLTEAHDVMFAVRAFWRELYDKRPVDLQGFQAVLGRHVPRVPEGAWTQVQQYSMQDLKSALDKADGKAPGPNHVEARFLKALPAPIQGLLVHSYRAILRGAPPPMHWRDAHIWLSPKVLGSARLDDYRPIALGQLDMKLLTGPLTQRITEVLTRHGVVSDWQQGALPASNTGPPLFMAQRQLQRGRPNYVFSFDACKAFDTAPHGALHLILRHLSVPPEVIDLLLFLHTCARLRIVTAHGLTQPVYMLRGVWQGNPEDPCCTRSSWSPCSGRRGTACARPEGPSTASSRPISTTCRWWSTRCSTSSRAWRRWPRTWG